MKRTLPWLLVLLLSGCLGSGAPTEAEPDADPDAEPTPGPPAQGGGDGPSPPPGEEVLAPPSPTLAMDFEGIECTTLLYSVAGEAGPVQDRMPPGFTTGAFTQYVLITHACRSALLGDQLARNVTIAVGYVFVTPPQGASTEHDVFLMEGFSDWPPLVEAWTRDGVDARLATFSRSTTPTGQALVVAAEDLEYSFRDVVPQHSPQDKAGNEFSLYAVDGAVVYHYAYTLHQFDFVFRPALAVVQGGFLAEFTGGAAPAIAETGTSAVLLKSKQNKE